MGDVHNLFSSTLVLLLPSNITYLQLQLHTASVQLHCDQGKHIILALKVKFQGQMPTSNKTIFNHF